MMSKQPQWRILVGRKAGLIADFYMPAHRLMVNDIQAFLKAVVARYSSDGPEDMALYYLNKRRGAPSRLPFADVMPVRDPDVWGYYCGDWDCYASATQVLDEDAAKALKEMLRVNRGT